MRIKPHVFSGLPYLFYTICGVTIFGSQVSFAAPTPAIAMQATPQTTQQSQASLASQTCPLCSADPSKPAPEPSRTTGGA